MTGDTRTDSAAREGSRVALVTCRIFPELYLDDHPLRDTLTEPSLFPRWGPGTTQHLADAILSRI